MANNNKRLVLEVDADQIDLRKMLKKDFLELSMKAISSANPNVNGSWFTKESMERSLGTFVNKPVLGYFKNDDFVSHNGEWVYDPETDSDYFDTSNGERILGLIRESDERKIEQGSDGLWWVSFTCALWTQYSFKQVKKLIKDARRAKREGGPAKNVSVEVDILDYEDLPNGVMKINEFNLIGVTILGSRNGVKVQPGIKDAGLSVVDVMGRELYAKQEKALRAAYEALDDTAVKKEETQMDNENKTPAVDENTVAAESAVQGEPLNTASATFEGCDGQEPENGDEKKEDECGTKASHSDDGAVCPDCGKNPCECEADTNCKASAEEGKACESKEECSEDDKGSEDDGACAAKCAADDEKGDEKKPESECGHMEETPKTSDFDCPCEGEEKRDPITDVAWLIDHCAWNIADLQESIEYYSGSNEEHKDYIVSVLNRILDRQKASEKELAALLAKIADGVSPEDYACEEKLCKYSNIAEVSEKFEALENDYNALQKSFDETTEKLQSAEKRVADYEHAEFMRDARAMISSANLSEELTKQFEKDCEESKISSLDDLKVKIAVNVFDAMRGNESKSASFGLATPVDTPDVDSFKETKTSGKNKSKNPWDALNNYLHS